MKRITIPVPGTQLVLKQLVKKDAPQYYALVQVSTADLKQFAPEVLTNYPSVQAVEQSIAMPGSNPTKLRFGIWHHNTMVGTINVTPSQQDAIVGYWIGTPYKGKGVATSATKALVAYLRDYCPRVQAIVAFVHPRNTASIRVLTKARFVQAIVTDQAAGQPPSNDLTFIAV